MCNSCEINYCCRKKAQYRIAGPSRFRTLHETDRDSIARSFLCDARGCGKLNLKDTAASSRLKQSPKRRFSQRNDPAATGQVLQVSRKSQLAHLLTSVGDEFSGGNAPALRGSRVEWCLGIPKLRSGRAWSWVLRNNIKGGRAWTRQFLELCTKQTGWKGK